MDAAGPRSANDDPLSSPPSSLSDLSPPRSDLPNHKLTRDSLNFGVAAQPQPKNSPLVPPPATSTTSTTSTTSATDQKQRKSRAPVVLPDGTVRERKKPGPKPKPKDPNAPEKPRKKRQKLSDVQAPTSAPVQTKLFNNMSSMDGVDMYRQDQPQLDRQDQDQAQLDRQDQPRAAQPSPVPQQRSTSEVHLGSTLPSNSHVAPLGTPNTPRPASSGRIFDPIRGDTLQAGQQSSRMSNPSASPTLLHNTTHLVPSNLVTSAPVSPLPPSTKPHHQNQNPFTAPPNSALAPHSNNTAHVQSTTAMDIDTDVKPAKQPAGAGAASGAASASNAPTPPAAPKRAKEQPPPLPSGSGLLSATTLGSIGSTPPNGSAGTNIFLTFSLVGQNNVTINFAREVERKYGFAALHPRLAARNERKRALAAASNALEKEAGLGSVDDMSLDLSEPDSNNETGGNEEDSANAPTDGRKRRKKKAEEYDRGDDFIDDTEMAWEESALMAKDGFFVYSGPLVPEPEKVTIERADGTVKRGRGRGRGGTARGDATGRGRGGGGGRGSRGGATVRKPRVTKADRAMMEQEKLEREKMAANLAAKQPGVPQYGAPSAS
ncbi:HPC2-domain-containing protein [Venturia nashicola]|uniref:HPC2-domain-containing protein n=1 Tax=Venturia nashicola TaxID=86259 RepID=A0A4Z1P3J5_9PEZI|nr:HPC2-domain-containing protein [Venturia nashicola]TLD20202.1 HPC2-domain-containing protein [Venturia nashicola]